MHHRSLHLFLFLTLIFASLPSLARGPWRASEGNTRGWHFMTPEERVEHQAKIRNFRTLDECESYRAEHHREMAERAARQGGQLGGGGRDICHHLRPVAGETR